MGKNTTQWFARPRLYPRVKKSIRSWVRPVSILLSLTSAWGCATGYKKVVLNEADFADKPLVFVNQVPFLEQPPLLCGPSALYMVTKRFRPDLNFEQVSQMTFTPVAKGAFKQDMLAAARRLGMAPYQVVDTSHIFDALAEGLPVVIFHRTQFIWKDYWHFSVITGYNRLHDTLYLHIGPYAYREADTSQVIGSWQEGGSWAYAILPPEKVPSFASFQETLDNDLAFLRLGLLEPAVRISEQLVARWPERYESDVVMAEALIRKKENRRALEFLRTADTKQPGNALLRQKIQEVSKNL